MTKSSKSTPTAAAPKKSAVGRRLIGAIVGIIIGVLIANIAAPQGLTVKAMWGMGIFVAAVIWWMAEVFPDYATALIMLCAWVGFKVVPFGTAFAGFSNATVWLLIGAFGMAAGVSKSGLLARISLYLMGLFPLSFKGQTLALLTTGTLITPLMPSGSAKIAVVAPFSASISEKMGYANKSQGAGGIFSAMYLSLGCIHPLFLSGSFLCYTVVGLLPKDMQANITWTTWFVNALPWGLTVLILGYLGILLLYKPEEEKSLSPEVIKEQRAALGPLTTREKFVAAVLVVTLGLWMTEKIHGINSALVAVLAMALMAGFDIIDRQSFKGGVAWDAIVFIGSIFGISGVFSTLKIDAWTGKVMAPYIAPLVAGNFFLFLAVLCIMVYLVRFVISSQLAVITIFTILLTPFAIQAGIHPWIMTFSTFVAINVWIFMYQNAQYLVAFFGAAGGEMVAHKQMIKLCLLYMVVSIIGLWASVPVWKLTGMIQ